MSGPTSACHPLPPTSEAITPPELRSAEVPGSGPRSISRTEDSALGIVPERRLAARFADFRELTKPRIAVMALITVTIGYLIAAGQTFEPFGLLAALIGIGAAAASSSVLNQWYERQTDSRMPRTARRPLPTGRISPTEALVFGVALGAIGLIVLAVFVNAITAWLTAATLFSYVGLYTPLKSRTGFCTTLGAVPGAMPPLLGWTAATGELSITAWILFGILFLWQFPHFLSIAWLYRDQYAGAGLKMLPRTFGELSVGYAVLLLVCSVLPLFAIGSQTVPLAGPIYAVAAIPFGLVYLAASVRFWKGATRETARKLLFTSLFYLPTVLAALLWDSWV